VRLFLRKSRHGSRYSVSTRSENAVARFRSDCAQRSLVDHGDFGLLADTHDNPRRPPGDDDELTG
jgi:hypothetical protein